MKMMWLVVGHAMKSSAKWFWWASSWTSEQKNYWFSLAYQRNPSSAYWRKDEHLQNQWGAFEQLKGYHAEGIYEGLFAFVQVQFILSQHSANYFARPNRLENYNKTFVFGWRDEQQKDITDAFVFAHQVLGIPALHRLVTVNMIPDASNSNLMVMRSYQIQATRAILQRMKEMEHNDYIQKEGAISGIPLDRVKRWLLLK